MAFPPLIFVLLLVVWLPPSSLAGNMPSVDGVLKLGREHELHRLTMPHGTSMHFKLEGLIPSQTYEVLLCYSAAIPAIVTVDMLELEETGGSWSSWLGPRRRLLNTEKHIFTAPDTEDGARLYEKMHLVRVTTAPGGLGVSWDPNYVPPPLLYNILIDKVFLGGIPSRVIPHICVVVVVAVYIVYATFSEPAKWPASLILNNPNFADTDSESEEAGDSEKDVKEEEEEEGLRGGIFWDGTLMVREGMRPDKWWLETRRDKRKLGKKKSG